MHSIVLDQVPLPRSSENVSGHSRARLELKDDVLFVDGQPSVVSREVHLEVLTHHVVVVLHLDGDRVGVDLLIEVRDPLGSHVLFLLDHGRVEVVEVVRNGSEVEHVIKIVVLGDHFVLGL